jgi:hypothetical protein
MFARGAVVGIVAFVVVSFAWLYTAKRDQFYALFPWFYPTLGTDCKSPAGASMQCRVIVKVTTRDRCPDPANPAEIEFVPSKIELNGVARTVIVWDFDNANPTKWWFCPSRGHGVFFDKPKTAYDDQFMDGYATDDANGGGASPGKVCFQHFRTLDANETSTKGKEYPYSVTFGNRDGTLKCTVDPWVRNG